MAATSFCFGGPVVYFLAQDVSELSCKLTMLLLPVLKSPCSEDGALFPFRVSPKLLLLSHRWLPFDPETVRRRL